MTTIKPKAVGNFLLTHEVENLISNYKQQRWAANSDKLGRADTLNIWWTIDEIENFLNEAKANNADGVKFCFGVYDTDANGNKGAQTVAMVATEQIETENGILNKNVYRKTEYGKNIVAYNKGYRIPPSTESDYIFDNDELGVTIVETAKNNMIVI